ncbi:uncharacterized protein K452DRAFT_287114 [Aplosporella prunicola CBS 121167]|uniref:Uncharacterized protein n=1 Tax=Aplosporella prunicola CBS 121167 TaxID=1176127 RepID=A0A6A6BEV8_9PEZI|nr:uncharacterized protein K452DRAFT_287114 [Aplosporella prunicola CBS 121167]KAF2141923.1 hypothetical protein K452DRAFT_287114 [Aplosporella prunicola CBS 121167]
MVLSSSSFSAPTYPLISAPVPLKTFNRARLTLSGRWTTQYDQGGLLLHLTQPGAAASSGSDRWLKTGIEYYQSRAFLSTVATQTYSDWSVMPPADGESKSVTVEVRREGDALGTSLWVYELVLGDDGQVKERRPLRECTWWFAEEDGWVIDVRAMAARPASKADVGGDLVVTFQDVEIDLSL